MPIWVSRAVTWLLAFAVGAAYSLAATIAHPFSLGWFPLGLILAIIGSAALLIAVRGLTGQRGPTLATGLGMIGMLLLISGRGPGGSVVVPEGTLGMVWTIALAICVLAAVAWPDLSKLRTAPAAPEGR